MDSTPTMISRILAVIVRVTQVDMWATVLSLVSNMQTMMMAINIAWMSW